MAWYENIAVKSAVREYKSRGDFDRDAINAAAHGWRVVSVTEREQRAGCIRIVLLWFLALLWRPKPRLLVAYAHD
jgi:hypothetical protein